MKVVILSTDELPSHTLFCISGTSDLKTKKKLEIKYGLRNLEVLFSADATYYEQPYGDACEDLEIRHVDSKRELPSEVLGLLDYTASPIGKHVFRCNPQELVKRNAKYFQTHVTCSPSLSVLVEEEAVLFQIKEHERRIKQGREQEYFKTFESQCMQLNALWESHWDRWVSEFQGHIKANAFPKLDNGFWRREKKQQEFELRRTQYMKVLLDLTRGWRTESRSFPTTFRANCRSCGGTGEVNASAGGPGNSRTYGGRNINTVFRKTGEEATIECGRKLTPGSKYFYRWIHNFSGRCDSCESNLFQPSSKDYSGDNWAKFSWCDKWCVYPFRDVESWWEWCGVWMTIFDWEAHSNLPYEARNDTRTFFEDFETVIDFRWSTQYPRPQLPED